MSIQFKIYMVLPTKSLFKQLKLVIHNMHILAWGPYAHGPKAIAQRTHTLRHHSLFLQYNGGQKERDKGINNDLQTATQKTKD
jgi:hypothetical protein